MPNDYGELLTPRLVLRPLELADSDQIQQLFPHWEIVKYLANRVPWPYPPDEAFRFIRDTTLPAIARGERWHWTIRFRSVPEQLIGSIALMKGENENRGFWVGLPWQGQGIMSEATEPVTDFWFNTLGFEVLRAPKAILNAASRRISEKNDMRMIRTEMRDYVGGRFPSEIWEITAEEWNARHGRQVPKSQQHDRR